jgi:dTDP-4-dehydrorhamnose 3,5-epimerase
LTRRLETKLESVVLVEPDVHGDKRGFLVETFREERWRELGIIVDFVQENHSRSGRGILRGLHFQTRPGQAKLVRCARGRIWDVVVDLRRDSPTYGDWEAHELDDARARQLYIPIGFAHGFCVLSDVADVTYKCSSYYDTSVERGFRYDDPDLDIAWPQDFALLVSERDIEAPTLAEIADDLPF